MRHSSEMNEADYQSAVAHCLAIGFASPPTSSTHNRSPTSPGGRYGRLLASDCRGSHMEGLQLATTVHRSDVVLHKAVVRGCYVALRNYVLTGLRPNTASTEI